MKRGRREFAQNDVIQRQRNVVAVGVDQLRHAEEASAGDESTQLGPEMLSCAAAEHPKDDVCRSDIADESEQGRGAH